MSLAWAAALALLASDFEVSGAIITAYPIAITEVAVAGPAGLGATRLRLRIEAMLAMTGMFKVLDRKSFLAAAGEPDEASAIAWPAWQQIGARGLLKLRVEHGKIDALISWRLFDPGGEAELLRGREKAAIGAEASAAPAICDAVILRLSGEPGPFASRILFVRREGRSKSLWTTAADGTGLTRITAAGTLNILPAWGAGANSVYFTSYASGRPDLYLASVGGGPWKAISRRPGLNTGATLSPGAVLLDGKKYPRLLALSLSKDGNAEIYLLRPDGGIVKRLTDHWGIDTSPAWSPNAEQLAFVSNRGGSPQLYILTLSTGARRRATFQGSYNQTPAWSPRGDLIAFTGRDERNVFDLFTVHTKTLKVTRLTQAQGHNEEPSWAPNGRMIVFTSTRNGKGPRLFVMREDGRHQRLLNPQLGEALTPRWSGFASGAR
jgi:TolB protein